MLRKQASFNQLPIEILFEIYSYLSLEQASVVTAVSKISNKIIQGNLFFWKKKYERHFPHLYDDLTSQGNINWYAEFRKTYAEEYKDLSTDDRRLFSLVKESDVESLQAKKIVLASFNKKDKSGKSLLNWAQKVGNQQVLNYFYQTAQASYITENQYIVDVSKVDEYGRTILYWALTCYQDYEQIALLLLQGSKFDEKYFTMQYQPIHIAAQEGRLNVVQKLIQNKPELLEQVDACGQTPLLWAAAKGRAEVVDYLISKGANLNVSSNHPGGKDHGKTPLYWAADNGYSGVVETLLKHGITPSLAKTIDKSKLNEKVKAEVELLEYIPKRSSQSKYKTSFTLFYHKFNFGFSKKEKLNAANALKNVVLNGADKSILDLYKKELNNGDLGSIYRSLRVR
ncbi:MAG: hypothetical protein A3F42_04485 [Gammaproteobacteria bacterium RIFCSPHIGHO2_12_FULL_37_34]|nr:MAG: hypothetical protein A3F42_04485 [Gammaproteobacteria bacterium RIFCSPHIGHO2_12_FULL_37_34]